MRHVFHMRVDNEKEARVARTRAALPTDTRRVRRFARDFVVNSFVTTSETIMPYLRRERDMCNDYN